MFLFAIGTPGIRRVFRHEESSCLAGFVFAISLLDGTGKHSLPRIRESTTPMNHHHRRTLAEMFPEELGVTLELSQLHCKLPYEFVLDRLCRRSQ